MLTCPRVFALSKQSFKTVYMNRVRVKHQMSANFLYHIVIPDIKKGRVNVLNMFLSRSNLLAFFFLPYFPKD